MLYDNNSYIGALNAWGSIHWAFGIFAYLTAKIATGIQAILREMYKLVNKRYMGLSREMEFHADAVAASVAGGNNLVTALHRIDIASSCYQESVNSVNEALSRKQVSRNLFADQQVVMQHLASEHKLALDNGLPVISAAFIASQHNSRINYKNQWASHPTNEERESKLNELGLQVPPVDTRAWEIFDGPEALQQKLTNNIYKNAKLSLAELSYYDAAAFQRQYEENFAAWRLPEQFRDFFQARFPELSLLDTAAAASPVSWEKIDTAENKALSDKLKHTETDLQLLEAIMDKQSGIKSFDFDGQKYQTKDAAPVLEQLRMEVAALRQQRDDLDKQLLAWLYQQNPKGLEAFKEWTNLNERLTKRCEEVLEILKHFYTGQLTIDEVNNHIANLKGSAEPYLKRILQEMLEYKAVPQGQLYDVIAAFVSRDYAYFTDSFHDAELRELQYVMKQSAEWIAKQRLAAFRNWVTSN
jgi:hypothetical protein